MSFRKAVLFLVAVAAATTVSAQAQLGVYGMFTVDRLSNIASAPQVNTPAFISTGNQVANYVNPLGGTGGVFYDFKTFGPVRLGADLRGTVLTTTRGALKNVNGSGARIYSTLGGVRAAVKVPKSYLKPYVQFSAGLGRSDYGLGNLQFLETPSNEIFPSVDTAHTPLTNNFQYEGLVGLDIKLLPVLDYRVAEFGYGGLESFGTNGHTYPIKQVSMGFVFHLPF